VKDQALPNKAISALRGQTLPIKGTHSTQQGDGVPVPPTHPEHTGLDMNAVIGWILQFGVIISSVVIAVGVILALVQDQLTSKNALIFPHSLIDVWSGVLALQPPSIIVLGLLLLLITPVVRVAASIVAFGLEHDRRYVILTTLVLLILILSFLLGKGGG